MTLMRTIRGTASSCTPATATIAHVMRADRARTVQALLSVA